MNNYFIYGGKPEEIQKFKKDIPKNLKIYPSVAYSKIKTYLSKMDILLMPSNTKKLRSSGGIGNIAKFTSPLKLFDYLAAGRIILASENSSYQHILKDNINSILCNSSNLDKWLKKFKNISQNKINIRKLKKKFSKNSKTFLLAL